MRLILTALLLICALSSKAQGDGPRSHLLAPTGIWGLNPKYLNLDQNILPAGNILVEGANFKIDVAPITFFHTFSIGNRFAQALVMINPGHVTATLDPSQSLPIESLETGGLSDGFVGLKMGLIGAPALNVKEFATHTPAFSLYGYFRVWYSGSYDPEKLVNLGTNRPTFEIAAPMSIPIARKAKNNTWLEVFPSLQFFGPNNSPARGSRTDRVTQSPLLLIENHLTHNFTPKFWAGADLRYQFGGTTTADGESDDNRINALGGGISAGYQILAFLSAYAGYGTIFVGDNGAQSRMIRLSLVFTYINLKKIQ